LGPMSNQELSQHLELSPASITHLLQPLVRHGILEEKPPEDYPEEALSNPFDEGQRRRRKITVYPNANLGYLITIEFTNSSVILRKVRFDLQLDKEADYQINLNRNADIVRTLSSAIQDMRDRDNRNLLGIGLTVSGLLDAEGTTVLQSNYQAFLSGLNLKEDLEKACSCPVVLCNDANALAVFERYTGKARNINNFFSLCINEGVGIGIFANGHLYEGYMNRAGESGHWIIDPQGIQAPNLPRGSFEAYVSQNAIYQQLKDAGFKINESQAYSTLHYELAVNHHPSVKAHKVLDTVCEKTALLCANLINIFAPEKIFIYGPLADLGDTFLSRVRGGIRSFTSSLKKQSYAEIVELSDQWKYAMCIGTAKCVIDTYLEKTVKEHNDPTSPRKKPVRLKPLPTNISRRPSQPPLP